MPSPFCPTFLVYSSFFFCVPRLTGVRPTPTNSSSGFLFPPLFFSFRLADANCALVSYVMIFRVSCPDSFFFFLIDSLCQMSFPFRKHFQLVQLRFETPLSTYSGCFLLCASFLSSCSRTTTLTTQTVHLAFQVGVTANSSPSLVGVGFLSPLLFLRTWFSAPSPPPFFFARL